MFSAAEGLLNDLKEGANKGLTDAKATMKGKDIMAVWKACQAKNPAARKRELATAEDLALEARELE